jgi:dTDP-4-amino-4,6-dideoxygalactose transaminase
VKDGAAGDAPPPLFDPPLRLVQPPRPVDRATVARRLMDVLDTGLVKHGHRWTTALTQAVRTRLEVDDSREVLLTVSGTAALRLCALALTKDRPRSDRRPLAVLPSFTFPATAEFLIQLGIDLVFCDVDKDTWTLDVGTLADVLASRPVDLVVCVDALGNPADYGSLVRLCAEAGVPLLADSAPALGSYCAGLPVGTQADAHAFSLSMAKVVSAAGAGGFAILPAGSRSYLEGGANWIRSSLMTEPNAVVALDQFPHIDGMLARRAAVAAVYQEFAEAVAGITGQQVRSTHQHSWVHWVMRCEPPLSRDDIAAHLAVLGIETRPYYAPALHLHHGTASRQPPLPVTEELARHVLALPMSSEMRVSDARRVVDGLRAAVNHCERGNRHGGL